jgi:hypothetical protein
MECHQRKSRMTNRVLLALTAAGAFAGCTTGIRNAPQGQSDLATTETRVYKEDYNLVYDAAKQALLDEGYDIATSKRDAGVISTAYRTEKMSDLTRATQFESRTRASVSVLNSAEGTAVRATWFWDISTGPGQWQDNSRNWTASDYRSRLSIYFDLVERNMADRSKH